MRRNLRDYMAEHSKRYSVYRYMLDVIKNNPKISDDEFDEKLRDRIFDGKTSIEECQEMFIWVQSKLRSKLGILTPLTKDESINEIMVNGYGNIFIERGSGMEKIDMAFEDSEELEEVIRNIAASVHREINELNPILDARLENGARVNAVFGNVALDGTALTIRKFSNEHITMEKLLEYGTLNKSCANMLKSMVEAGYNIFISGGTSSGKTTFLNALADYIPQDERVIVIEDSRELALKQIKNIVQMECHNANTLGKGLVSMDMLIKTSLRMRPTRLIVGEVRGKEVADMLQAMNTGHDGSMSTGHGNSVKGMIRRLEAMYLMASKLPMDTIRAQIIEGIDIFVHLARLKDGRRTVSQVVELIGYENGEYVLNEIFNLDSNKLLAETGNKIINTGKFELKGTDYV